MNNPDAPDTPLFPSLRVEPEELTEDLSDFAEALDAEDSEVNPSSAKAGVLSNVVSAAIKLWLRSQVQECERLQVQLRATNRQLLGGNVPEVSVEAEQAIYRGLHLSQISILGEHIRLNLRPVLRGKPFKLSQTIQVGGNLYLTAADLTASLDSPFLAQAIKDLVLLLLRGRPELAAALSDVGDLQQMVKQQTDSPQLRLGDQSLTLGLMLPAEDGKKLPLFLRLGITLANSHVLQLQRNEWLTSLDARRGFALPELDGFTIDLGPDVQLQEVQITPEFLRVKGQASIR